MKLTKKYLSELTYNIISAAIEVHKAMGPGLLESIYHRCLEKEFELRGIQYSSEQIIPVNYKGLDLNAQIRCDFLIEDAIVLEIKAVNEMHPIFKAQLLTYMKLLEKPKGILINFNEVNVFSSGQETFVNEFFRVLKEA